MGSLLVAIIISIGAAILLGYLLEKAIAYIPAYIPKPSKGKPVDNIPKKLEYDIYYRPGKPKKNLKEISAENLPERVREEIVCGFATFIETREKEGGGLSPLRDVSELPYDKNYIIHSYLVGIAKEPLADIRELMSACILCVSDYQEGVGNKRLNDPMESTSIMQGMPVEQKVNDEKFRNQYFEGIKTFSKEAEQLAPFEKAASDEMAALFSLCQKLKKSHVDSPPAPSTVIADFNIYNKAEKQSKLEQSEEQYKKVRAKSDICYKPEEPKKNLIEDFPDTVSEDLNEEVVCSFATFIEKNSNGHSGVRDVSELPYTKSNIIYSYLTKISNEPLTAKRKLLVEHLLCVADYQEGVSAISLSDTMASLSKTQGMTDDELCEAFPDIAKSYVDRQNQLEPFVKAAAKERANLSSLCQQV